MTGHDRFLELAASAIDFELTRDEAATLERHLAGCDACRRRVAAIRSDARAIAALPALSAGWSVPAMAIPTGVRFAPASWLRLVVVAALTAALVIAAVLVGTELVRRQQLLDPTATTAPSATPTETAIQTSSPEPSSAGGAWQVERIDVADLPFGITAVASAGSRLVAVGWRTCLPESEPTDCWANAFTSDDGGRSWVAAPRSDALVVGFGCCSGPEPGMLDVAAGHGAFVAIGYGQQFGAVVWKSVDGQTWTIAPADATWDQARVRTVASTPAGWVIGGEVFLDSGPRAAIWTSPDGVTWTRVPDGPAFDIGGYLDTGEEPGAGGIADVIAIGTMTIAIGSSCDQNGFACAPAAWTSTGGTWSRSAELGLEYGKLRAVAPFGQDVIAAGLACGLEACGQNDRSAATVRSRDGAGWATTLLPGTSGSAGIRAIAGSDGYLVAVIEGIDGVDGVDAHSSGELILAGSVDGETWALLDGVADLGLTDMREVGVAVAADGFIVIVGWGQDTSDAGFASFVVRVTRTPS